MQCAHCGKSQFYYRHENVVHEIKKSSLRHGILIETNPTHLPLPGKEKGGADFIGWVAAKMYFGDVAIVYDQTPKRHNMRYEAKQLKYSDAIEITGATCFPYIMNISGVIHHESCKLLKEMLHNNSRAFVEVCVNTQFAMLRGIYQGIHRLKVRTSLGNFFETKTQTD